MSVVAIRTFVPEEDSGIIFGTWPKGAYYRQPESDRIPAQKKLWFAGFYERAKQTLKRASIYVAYLQDTPNFIVGYCIVENEKLKWIYVKKAYRGQGIAKLLMKNREELWKK